MELWIFTEEKKENKDSEVSAPFVAFCKMD